MKNYYMAESVFAMRLVNLRSVTCYTDQNFNENAHFGAINLFTKEKTVEININLEDLDFDFVFQHFNLWKKAMKKLTRNLIEEDSSKCFKILS